LDDFSMELIYSNIFMTVWSWYFGAWFYK